MVSLNRAPDMLASNLKIVPDLTTDAEALKAQAFEMYCVLKVCRFDTIDRSLGLPAGTAEQWAKDGEWIKARRRRATALKEILKAKAGDPNEAAIEILKSSQRIVKQMEGKIRNGMTADLALTVTNTLLKNRELQKDIFKQLGV